MPIGRSSGAPWRERGCPPAFFTFLRQREGWAREIRRAQRNDAATPPSPVPISQACSRSPYRPAASVGRKHFPLPGVAASGEQPTGFPTVAENRADRLRRELIDWKNEHRS